MSHLDDMPNRSRNHEIEDNAIVAFEKLLVESGVFIFQGPDRKDYGTDCQIEVAADGRATNVRVDVQLKGTEKALNADGALSIGVPRTNLNYLLMQPYSIYVAHHAPTDTLWIRTSESVVRQYAHGGTNWTTQESVTVSFVETLTIERLRRLADIARAHARSGRDRRVDHGEGAVANSTSQFLNSPREFHVPDEPDLARTRLAELFDQQADDVISASFEKFEAVFGAESDEIALCYMAEINQGMDDMSEHPERIERAIRYFRSRLGNRRYQDCGLHYTIGNASSALHDEQEAKLAFEAALVDPALAACPEFAAQVHKNLGSSFARLGDNESAIEQYREALRLDPGLAEAHNCLGVRYVRLGRYEEALHHLDQVLFSDQQQGRTSAVAGWRANALFNLGEGAAAFRVIIDLLPRAGRIKWIWPWCRRLVASFGRANAHNARHAVTFWHRFVQANPDDPAARWELLMATFYLRGKDEDVGKSYSEFRKEFDQQIGLVDADNAALPWDRLGHWAQDDEDWVEAERCFRNAYDLAKGEYGYCLAVALNALERFDESVPLLLDQAQTIQPDANSWFHLGIAYANLSNWQNAFEALGKSVSLDPDNALPIFELGGAHWNSGDKERAVEVWAVAVKRFPNHELASKLKRDLPSLFLDPSAG